MRAARSDDTLMRWWTLNQLKSKHASTRLAAVERLGQQGGATVVEPLTAAMSDPDPRVRCVAAQGLGRTKSAEAVAALVAGLKDSETEVRVAAARALQDTGHPSAIPALVAMLGDGAGAVGWQAAQSLKALHWQPQTDQERVAWHLATGDFDSAAVYGAAAVQPLAKLAKESVFHRSIRAVECLADLRDAQAVKPLLESLRSDEPGVRSAAAAALGQVGDARAVDPLLRALRDPHRQVCLAAASSLSRIGDVRAVEPIIDLLVHRAPDVRAGALDALGRLRDARAVPNIVQCLQDPDTEVRENAVGALGVLRDEQAIEPLVVALTDSYTTVRQAAARALRTLDPHWERSREALQAVPRLQEALKSKEYWVRHSAAEVLNRLGRVQPRETPLFTDGDGARQKRHAAATVLLSLLGDRDRAFRQAAVEALGRLGVPETVGHLAIRLTDDDRGVQISAARSLESLRWQPETPAERARQLVLLEKWPEAIALGRDALEVLAETACSPYAAPARRAIEALVQIGGEDAIENLRAIAESSMGLMQDEARAALGVLGVVLSAHRIEAA